MTTSPNLSSLRKNLTYSTPITSEKKKNSGISSTVQKTFEENLKRKPSTSPSSSPPSSLEIKKLKEVDNCNNNVSISNKVVSKRLFKTEKNVSDSVDTGYETEKVETSSQEAVKEKSKKKLTWKDKIDRTLSSAAKQFSSSWRNEKFIQRFEEKVAADLPNPYVTAFNQLELPFFNASVGVCSIQADRKTQEDQWIVEAFPKENPQFLFSAVMDGHGGSEAVTMLKEKLSRSLKSFPQVDKWKELAFDEKADYLKETLKTIDDEIVQIQRETLAKAKEEDPWVDDTSSGTTLTFLLFTPDLEVWCGNIGDTRALRVDDQQGLQLSRDHSPNDPLMKEQIKKRNGKVDSSGCVVVKSPTTGLKLGQLGTARAIGDAHLKEGERSQWVVRSNPEFSLIPLQNGYYIMASDGLWNEVSSEDLTRAVRKLSSQEDTKEIASRIVSNRYQTRIAKCDNTTVIVLKVESKSDKN